MSTSDKSKHSIPDKFFLGCRTTSSGHQEDTRSASSRANSSIMTDEEVNETGRHHWGKKAEYILAAVGYCVGLGNIWRFPYVCMRNGGGAFLIPFFLSLFVCALPVYFLESAMGQFNGKSTLHVWSMVPLFKGLGISMNILTFFCSWYYSIILAWSLIYLAYSFSSPLPWTVCGQAWNTDNCFIGIKHNPNTSSSDGNETLGAVNNASSLALSNISSFLGSNGGNISQAVMNNSTNVTRVSAAEEFWLLSMSPPHYHIYSSLSCSF